MSLKLNKQCGDKEERADLRDTSIVESTGCDELIDKREKEEGEREGCMPTGSLTKLFCAMKRFCSGEAKKVSPNGFKCIQ